MIEGMFTAASAFSCGRLLFRRNDVRGLPASAREADMTLLNQDARKVNLSPSQTACFLPVWPFDRTHGPSHSVSLLQSSIDSNTKLSRRSGPLDTITISQRITKKLQTT